MVLFKHNKQKNFNSQAILTVKVFTYIYMNFLHLFGLFKSQKSHIDWSNIFIHKKSDIEKYLSSLKLSNYKLIEHEKYGFIVDVYDSVDISFLNLSKIKVKFNKIYGDFNCSNNKLKTLLGCPEEVQGSFFCFNNKLKNLEYSPKKIHKDYLCFSNQLASLYGAPHEIYGDFYCSFNQLQTLEYSPKVVNGDYNCSSNMINSLWGSPKIIRNNFDCSDNVLHNLEYTPLLVYGHYLAKQNPIDTLEYLPNKVLKSFFIERLYFSQHIFKNLGETLEDIIKVQESIEAAHTFTQLNKNLKLKDNHNISIKI